MDADSASEERIAELERQVEQLREDNERSTTLLIARGNEEISNIKAKLAVVTAERDSLREHAGNGSAELPHMDVPTLEQEVVAKEQQLQQARSNGDVEKYESLSAEHAKLSSAYARALRLRPQQ